ncbi:MAG: hypothetical protein OEZ34_04350 [Spirochaetia bacterium]|nr:hypothetical protein [Spirochaetia bacterium]
MKDTLEDLLEQIIELEKRVSSEIDKKQSKLKYKIIKRKILFEKEVQKLHRKFSVSLPKYLISASILSYLISPFIYSMIIPALLLDLFVTVYQWVCFPVYKTPYIKRSDYIIIDRHYLKYLNLLERFNCVYCGYFNGLLAYVTEISAVTEHYWCPIKHARNAKRNHSLYPSFMDYGDGSNYRKGLEDLREMLKQHNKEKSKK